MSNYQILVGEVESVFYTNLTKGDNWQHQIRVEAILTPESNCFYPVCMDGKRACPPEDCGGPWEFMAQK
ncbi:hypothetical protein H6G36_13580 [Anabaena minutissima FACHB-250]|nr:hypothetical protein [Anabaena minutissima FACHB-250]